MVTQAPVNALTAQYFGSPGSNTRYYWVQAIYPSGRSILSGPATITNCSSLTNSNFVSISWRPSPGAIGYDVIETSTSSTPTVSDTITAALIFGTTDFSFSDTGQTLQSWTYETGNGGVDTQVTIDTTIISGGTPADILVVNGDGTLGQAATLDGATYLDDNSVPGIKVATNLVLAKSTTGVDASVTPTNVTGLTGVLSGDILVFAYGITSAAMETAHFAATANGTGTISQLDTDLSGETILFFFLSQQAS